MQTEGDDIMTPAVPKPGPRKKKAPKRPKARNVKRHTTEWARKYGSEARVLFVKSLACCACGVVGYSEVAHIGNGGAGRKADARYTVPLCGARYGTRLGSPWKTEGCHAKSHRIGIRTFERMHHLDLPALAEETERSWQAHLESQGT